MYMVIGEQQVEAVDADEQRARFAHMADVVRRTPGFVRGWWGLEENVSGVRLRIMEIGVSAEAD